MVFGITFESVKNLALNAISPPAGEKVTLVHKDELSTLIPSNQGEVDFFNSILQGIFYCIPPLAKLATHFWKKGYHVPGTTEGLVPRSYTGQTHPTFSPELFELPPSFTQKMQDECQDTLYGGFEAQLKSFQQTATPCPIALDSLLSFKIPPGLKFKQKECEQALGEVAAHMLEKMKTTIFDLPKNYQVNIISAIPMQKIHIKSSIDPNMASFFYSELSIADLKCKSLSFDYSGTQPLEQMALNDPETLETLKRKYGVQKGPMILPHLKAFYSEHLINIILKKFKVDL